MATTKDKSKAKDTDTLDIGAIDFSELAGKVTASGKRGRPSEMKVSEEATHIIHEWLKSESQTLPFAAFEEAFGSLVRGKADEKEILAKARGDMTATQAADTTTEQGKVAKQLRDVVDGAAEVRPLEFDGSGTFGLVRRNTDSE